MTAWGWRPGMGELTVEGHGERLEMKVFYTWIMAVPTQVYTFVTTPRSVHFLVCKLYLKK